MSFIHDMPYLGAINHGSALRAKATKLQSYAELNEARGGKFGEKLKAFWEDQKARVNEDHGHPADGLNLEVPGLDLRVECYRVLSAIRLNPASDNKAAWAAFCDYFINRWTSDVPVTAIAFTSGSAKTAAVGATGNVAVTVTPEDATTSGITFLSSDTSVATVTPGSEPGTAVVTGVKEGAVTITATALDGSGVSATLAFTVTAAK